MRQCRVGQGGLRNSVPSYGVLTVMVRRIVVVVVLLSLASLTGPAPFLPRASAQDLSGSPSDGQDSSRQHGRPDHGDRLPDDDRGGQPASRLVAGGERSDPLVRPTASPSPANSSAATAASGTDGSAAPSGDKATLDAQKADRRVVFGQDSHWQSSASSGPGQSKETAGEKPKPYRFRSPKERLPEGLPGFFSRDANGDGQISMSEYSRRWSDRMVAEFRRHDRDNDGMITPKECSRLAATRSGAR
jgi:hypothetical protein